MSALAILAQQNGGAVVGGAIGLMIVLWILAIAATVFWIWMLIDVLVSNLDTTNKILWFLVVFFLHFIGALLYLFLARQRRYSPATV
ncbi:MAG TPA: PLD nuclease N-terminal domain-containing protein [Urbifossiella sp.]|jgi:hypothetical protein|nr:PLD nuclease N-terminal domain-containing protein [Urbifossiella sp.]